ncbi:MAG: SUMF1/EgtB/PvdO family nonheme iron enzyme [Nannocystaceae bacterium]
MQQPNPHVDLPLGAFFEDVDFKPGSVETREIVLAPGPDVVRLHGSFLLGPTPWLIDLSILESINRTRELEEDVVARGFPERIRIEMPTFDLDRTEVTAEQFLECRRAAMTATGSQRPELPICFDAAECARLQGCYHDIRDQVSRAGYSAPFCTVPNKTEDRTPVGRRGNAPANCISKHEAALYCKWVGKRLPTDEELEYAARGGDELLTYPWGNARYTAERGDRAQDSLWTNALGYYWGNLMRQVPYAVCSWPAGNSRHGICDLASNVMEMGDLAHPEWGPRFKVRVRGSTETQGRRFQLGDWTDLEAREDVGFRCARDVSPGAGWAPAEPAR